MPYKVLINLIKAFTPTDLYGIFQIKAWTRPFQIFRFERVKCSLESISIYKYHFLKNVLRFDIICTSSLKL